jgi:Uma2 family endonuclease
VRTYKLGEVFFAPIDCILSDTTIVQPDLVFLETSRLHLISARGIEGPPTLVVEVLSPTTTSIDRSTKRQLYARYGVPYYWIIDPGARTIEAHTLSEPGYRLTQRATGSESISIPPFSDLSFSLASLWE